MPLSRFFRSKSSPANDKSSAASESSPPVNPSAQTGDFIRYATSYQPYPYTQPSAFPQGTGNQYSSPVPGFSSGQGASSAFSGASQPPDASRQPSAAGYPQFAQAPSAPPQTPAPGYSAFGFQPSASPGPYQAPSGDRPFAQESANAYPTGQYQMTGTQGSPAGPYQVPVAPAGASGPYQAPSADGSFAPGSAASRTGQYQMTGSQVGPAGPYQASGMPAGASVPYQMPVTPAGASGPYQVPGAQSGPVPPAGSAYQAGGNQPSQEQKSTDGPQADKPDQEKKNLFHFSFRPSFNESDVQPRKVTFKPLHIGIMVATVLLLGWYLYTNYAPQAATSATIVAGRYGVSYPGDALIVRNEVPYDADSVTSIRYYAVEGAEVANKTPICEVFSSGFSTRELTTLQDYRDQIRDYEQELLAEETTYDAQLERVESDVLTQAREVRSLLSGTKGNLINLETNLKGTITRRQQYLREKYANDQRLSRLLDDESAQQQRIDSWTKSYIATKNSLISFYTDGYEYGLTVGNCLTFTPSEVRDMINGKLPEGNGPGKSKTTIYRTITDDVWYVLMLSHDLSWNPVKGQIHDLELNQFENTTVKAEVVDFTRSGGELLVQFKVEGNVESVLYMRSGTVHIGDNVNTMLVPSRAIYHQNGMDGVVVIDGSNRFFVPVQVIHSDGNDRYVDALQPGLLFEGQEVMLF